MAPPARRRSGGVLAGPVDAAARLARTYPTCPARPGLRVVHRASGFAGSVTSVTDGEVVLQSPTGRERRFRNEPGAFSVDAQPVRLVVPRDDTTTPVAAHLAGTRVVSRRTASGSRAVVGARARVARASRILVEGVHDAELVERVWGDDLRLEGIVVERMDGADDLAHTVATFGPGPRRRLGVLLDHLVAGTKESRLAAQVRSPHVLVVGTPYVDVWQAIRPRAAGIDAWPAVPRGTPWKEGVCARLGVADPRSMWRRLLGSVESWKDLEPPFVRCVEQLIDFVAAEGR
jgi:hypothetical protein